MTGHRKGSAFAAAGIVSILLIAARTSGAPPKTPIENAPPAASGLTESTGISLALIDVDVKDEKGRPIKGLKKEDFIVQLGISEWPIYSVDDFCQCDAPSQQPAAGVPPETSKGDDTAAVPALPAAGEDAVRYVIYFDFSQLAMEARFHAFREARRWLHEVKRPDDSVMVAAFSTVSGPRELCAFTTDTEKLLSALATAEDDPALVDPFPSAFDARQDRCDRDVEACLALGPCVLPTMLCVQLAREEFDHGKRSLRALRYFFNEMEEKPGRKVMLLFQGNGTIFPARFYRAVTDFVAGDHETDLDTVGADAVASRTAIFAVYPGGGLDKDAINLNSNLADYSGGDYNRPGIGMSTFTTKAREECPCIYRIGLLPKEDQTNRIYRTKVYVRGKELDSRWRLRFLGDLDRWLRKATAVLEYPERATDINVSAAIVPLAYANGTWDLSVQVAFDLASLETIPSAGGEGGRDASWEVGGLLVRADGTRSKELLGLSSLRRKGEGVSTSAVVHANTFTELTPGSYRLAAFVRDRTAAVFGGTQVSIDLPSGGSAGVAGPLFLHAKRHLTLPLPLLKKNAAATPTRVSEVSQGAVPGRSGVATRGEMLEAWTWFCPGERAPAKSGEARPPGSARGSMAFEGKPAVALAGTTIDPAGTCVRVRDRIDTAPLEPGTYTYEVVWSGGAAAKSRREKPQDAPHAALSFTVVESLPRPPAASAPSDVEGH